MPDLRGYQIKAVNDVHEAFSRNEKVMLQMPTGTGKTTVFCEIVKHHINTNGNRILVLVHRKELVHQIVSRLHNFGFQAGIIMAGHEPEYVNQIQVASVQSIARRPKTVQNISLIIVDEAHHIKAKTYLNIIKKYSGQKPHLLGVTATPIRLSGEGFDDVFDCLIKSLSVNEFIDKGYLAPIRHYAWHIPNTDGIKITATKDYDEKELEQLMSQEKEIAAVVESYENYVKGKKALVFAVNVAHAEKVVHQFKSKGFKAELIEAKTKKEDRDLLVQQFREGKLSILVNVNIFTEGFDCPDVEAVLLARPTKSLTLYLQQVGRVMRPSPDKVSGVVLDNAGLWKEHGLANEQRYWTLRGTEIKRKRLRLNDNKEVVESENQEPNIPEEKRGAEFEIINNITASRQKKMEGKWALIVKYFQGISGGLLKVGAYQLSSPQLSRTAALKIVYYVLRKDLPEVVMSTQVEDPFQRTMDCFEETMELFFKSIQDLARIKLKCQEKNINAYRGTQFVTMQVGSDVICFHPSFEMNIKAAEKVVIALDNWVKDGFLEEKRFLKDLYDEQVVSSWRKIWADYIS